MLCVLSNIEGFVALGTSEAGRMPVFTKRRLLFSEVDLFTTLGALHGYFFFLKRSKTSQQKKVMIRQKQ